MQLTTGFLAVVLGASAALAAPSTHAGFGRRAVNISQPFEVDQLYMQMASVYDTSSGVDVKFTATDANTGVTATCDTADVLANTVYACDRPDTKWVFNVDFSKLSIQWYWSPGEISDDGLNGNYRANGSTTVDWNCASSGKYGQQCSASKFSVPIQQIEAWA
ncbi:secreted hemolysin-type calcium-binding protein [Diplodia corticola]|uniref:Secreted hemolysin-type calcium-binding protein n=1 Tax=Diplodia corticola TaxID=236234 RepID=A0A1J9QRU5_9PEZI|nr:secreted hemolysin-type calcium-binding protein [Diplodia corticola]OJD31176.1 secreted hemolysin-type calcium-binding protein [Diplodia corticola]